MELNKTDLAPLIEELEALCLGLQQKKEWAMLTVASKVKKSLIEYVENDNIEVATGM